jgi:ribosomal protein S12 methylthiotransferase
LLFFAIFVGIMSKKKRRITVGFVSLGCPKNVVDSERMLAEIAEAGLLITAEPDNADVVVINTCGFIAPAKAESLEAIRDAVKRKGSGAVKKVIVAGCLPERAGRGLLDEVDGIDAVVGLGQRDNIAEIIKKTLSGSQATAYLCRQEESIHDDRSRLLITPSHWAYLRISEGCNHRCSFCTIPSIRGRFRSKPQELVLAEADELVSAGVVELNIIAQDSSYYGRDLQIKDGLAELIGELEKIAGLSWIRLMYLYPTEIDDKLIETIAASEKIVRYLDIPIQHVNNQVLKAMRRPDTKDHLQRLFEKLRCAIGDIVLRTTVIVGFPGESERQLAELLEFIKWAQFDALGCFKFYPEAGTAAAQMPGQVSERVKQQRQEELMLAQQEIAFAKNKNRVGNKVTCLVDCVDNKGGGQGRFYGQAPDIDSVCIIKKCTAAPGEFINTKVFGTKDYDLVVEQI